MFCNAVIDFNTALLSKSTELPTIQDIEDKTSSEVLAHFYTHLLQGNAEHIALTKAKQDYLKKHKNPHPQQWLSMVCIGDTAPISSITPE